MTLTAMDEAAAIEADAAEYPDQRYEILIEAAEAWRSAGRPERARELLLEVIAAGGTDAAYARCELASDWFEDGADEEAYAELARLARESTLDDGHCTLVAELLAERGDLSGALQWYDRGVARLVPEDLEELRGPDGWTQMSAVMIRGRRQVREQLGLPMDTTDEIASGPSQEPMDLDDLRARVHEGRTPRRVRMLVFQRAERAEAARRWPGEYDETDEHYTAVERRWRELAESGVPAIRVVPGTVAGLCEFAEQVGGSPTDAAVRARYEKTIAEADTIAWPPGRNDRCWCGSGAKYKKCCGRVH